MIGLRVSELPLVDGEANRAGILKDDVIARVEDTPLESVDHLIELMSNRAGETVSLQVIRDSNLIIKPVNAGPLGVKLTVEDIAFAYKNTLKAKEAKEIEDHLAKMILTTAPWIEGRPVTETLDILSSECAFGINFISDAAIGIADVTGGKSLPLQDALKDAKIDCLKKMKKQAAELHADAVIAVDLNYSEFTGGGKRMIFVAATGTAVKLSEEKPVDIE